jgi:hypothetical protein
LLVAETLKLCSVLDHTGLATLSCATTTTMTIA